MAAVARITIHHEGAGQPRQVDLSAAGYSAFIHPRGGTFDWYRNPEQSWATRHFNHVSLDLVVSGNRNSFALEDDEVIGLANASLYAYKRGLLIATPGVHPHGTLGVRPPGLLAGSDPTECPGTFVLGRFPMITTSIAHALGHGGPVPPPQTHPTLRRGDHGGAVLELQSKLRVGFRQAIAADGIFGPATEGAVRNVQHFVNITVDGICGPVTWRYVDGFAALNGY